MAGWHHRDEPDSRGAFPAWDTHTGGGSLLCANNDDPGRGHEIRARPGNRLRGSDGENDPRLRKPESRGGEWTGALHVSGKRRGAWFSGTAFPTNGANFAQTFSRRSSALKSAAGGHFPDFHLLRRGAGAEGRRARHLASHNPYTALIAWNRRCTQRIRRVRYGGQASRFFS